MRIWAWTLVLMAMENAKEETFSERNGLDEVEENDSNDTLVLAYSQLLFLYEVGLTEVTSRNNSRKYSNIGSLLTKN